MLNENNNSTEIDLVGIDENNGNKKRDMKKFLISLGISAAIFIVIILVFYFFVKDEAGSIKSMNSGKASYAAGDFEAAYKFYQTAVKKDGDNREARLGIAESLMALGRNDEALKYINKCIDKHPGEYDYYLFKIRLYVKTNRTKEAISFIDSIKSTAILMNLKEQRPANVKSTPDAGTYSIPQKVTLFSDGNSIIYYTTDGTVPDLNSSVADKSSPISVGQGKTVINAIAVNKDFVVSDLTPITFNVFNNDQAYNFEDPKIEKMVRSALGIQQPNAVLYRDLARVTSLSSYDQAGNKIDGVVNTLQDLAAMNSLTEIILADEPAISDLSIISTMTSLKRITMKNCGIDSGKLAEIAKCSWISYLNIDGNGITSLKDIASLVNLDGLSAKGNSLTDLTGLENMTLLTRLDLSSNTISELNTLSSLSTLTSVDLSANNITDISYILSLGALTELNVSDNKISDITGINSLGSVSTLNISGNPIGSISSLKDFSSLSSLDLSRIKIDDLSVLSNLKLTKLVLKNCGIMQITALSPITGLTTLDLRNDPAQQAGVVYRNEIINLNPLITMQRLSTLYLDNNLTISDLSPLNSCGGLRYVYCNGCPLADVDSITNPNISVNKN